MMQSGDTLQNEKKVIAFFKQKLLTTGELS